MGEVFIGSKRVAAGQLTEYELRRYYRPIFRDIDIPREAQPSLRDRTEGAWLWSRRRGVVAGLAASALYGARSINAGIPIELISASARPQRGLVVRNETLADDEWTTVAGLPATTPSRTAFDLGRFLRRGEALARLDGLAREQPFSTEDVLLLAKCHRGVRGLAQLRELLPLVDAGARSLRESWLRLLLIDGGLPRPTTQIPVYQYQELIAALDMGWEDYQVALEYDGAQHQTLRSQYVKDLRRHPRLAELGWKILRVVKEDPPVQVVAWAYEALESRGWRRVRR